LIKIAYFSAFSCKKRSKRDGFTSYNLAVAAATEPGLSPSPSMKRLAFQLLVSLLLAYPPFTHTY
jgi:hypothetical protein